MFSKGSAAVTVNLSLPVSVSGISGCGREVGRSFGPCACLVEPELQVGRRMAGGELVSKSEPHQCGVERFLIFEFRAYEALAVQIAHGHDAQLGGAAGCSRAGHLAIDLRLHGVKHFAEGEQIPARRVDPDLVRCCELALQGRAQRRISLRLNFVPHCLEDDDRASLRIFSSAGLEQGIVAAPQAEPVAHACAVSHVEMAGDTVLWVSPHPIDVIGGQVAQKSIDGFVNRARQSGVLRRIGHAQRACGEHQ